MRYDEFLTTVIDTGLASVRDSIKDEDKLRGAVAGFEACRGRSEKELLELELWAQREMLAHHGTPLHWEKRYQQLQIEFVVRAVAAAQQSSGMKPIAEVTTRGVMAAANVLGVKSSSE